MLVIRLTPNKVHILLNISAHLRINQIFGVRMTFEH